LGEGGREGGREGTYQGGETDHVEMETGKRHHVHRELCEGRWGREEEKEGEEEMNTGAHEGEREGRRTYLAEVAVELPGETEAGGGATDGGGDEVIEVTVGGCGQLEGAEADVIQSLQGGREWGGEKKGREGGR